MAAGPESDEIQAPVGRDTGSLTSVRAHARPRPREYSAGQGEPLAGPHRAGTLIPDSQPP